MFERDDCRSVSSGYSTAQSEAEEEGVVGTSSPSSWAAVSSVDEHVIDETANADEGVAESFRIDHSRGEYRLPAKNFLRRTTDATFGPSQAIRFLQRKYTFDFGSRAAGSRPCTADDSLIPTFHLDMIAIVGRPMRPIVHRSDRFFDNVTISFQNWAAPYKAKHAEGGIGFDLRHRTFRIASGATRECWFIVMHPRLGMLHVDRSRAETEASIKNSALEGRHAEFLAEYIKHVFLYDELVGEGIEAAWRLGQARNQNVTFNKWATFQSEFMAGWDEYVAAQTTDPFWVENRPAFHAYDYGANITLEVTPQIQALDKEEPVRGSGEYASDEEEGSSWDNLASESPGQADADSTLYTGGLAHLKTELAAKFDLESIWSMSYALAVNLYCLDGETAESEPEDQAARCMLANRNAVMQEFPRQRDWTFYPVGFSPVYGNFAANQPPEFLTQNVLTVMRNNLSARNDGVDVLACGYFQAYSNVKRCVRHRPDDLLAKKSLTTAVLALPAAEMKSHHIRAKHKKLEAQMKGMRTPEDQEQSRPFAREAQRIQAAMDGEDYGYRMEQVVSMQVSNLCHGRRTFTTILHPIFQLIRFYLREPDRYRHILHTFVPRVYPGILQGFSALFDKVMVGLQEKSELFQPHRYNVAIAEASAAFDRLGSYLFSGSAKVVGHGVFRHLGTTESLRHGGWPYVNPHILNVQDDYAVLNRAEWPRRKDGQPALLHPLVLEFYYGKQVGATRQANVWLNEFRGMEVGGRHTATSFIVDVFEHMWVPQTKQFIERAVERQCKKWNRALEGMRAAEAMRQLKEWTGSDRPFSWSAYSQMLPILCSNAGQREGVVKSRRDIARELYRAARENSDQMRRRWAAQEATWLSVLGSVMSNTNAQAVGEECWIGAISSAMLECSVEAMPVASRGKLSSRSVVQLIGMAPSRAILATRPGTLKRAAVEASERSKRPRLQQRVDFGCEIPFVRIPRLIDEGLRAQDQMYEGGDQRVREHYCLVRHCLDGCLGDPLCDLMLMLCLTLASCSVTPAAGEEGFVEGKKKDARVFAANLVTRMLWYLQPQYFPATTEANSKALSIGEMTKKIEHKGANNRMLLQLRWVRVVRGERKHPRNSDLALVEQTQLMQRYQELRRGLKDAEQFIRLVFRSRDEIWVERCASIIREEGV